MKIQGKAVLTLFPAAQFPDSGSIPNEREKLASVDGVRD
jgi:hypothetical protein